MSVILELGAKGRAVIPAAVRQEAGVEVGQALIAHAEGTGRIVLETPAAVQTRVWAAAPDQDKFADTRARAAYLFDRIGTLTQTIAYDRVPG